GVDDYDAAINALNAHFNPHLNPDLDMFKLRQARQTKGESVDKFYNCVRALESSCSVDDQSKGVRAQIIQGSRSAQLGQLILPLTVDTGTYIDLSTARAEKMEEALNKGVEG
ncbi:hypothetical protein NDU88_005456, partial [Pleurodeles waltl]